MLIIPDNCDFPQIFVSCFNSGPFFIDNMVNGKTYLDLLEEYVFPAIKMFPGWKDVIFQ